MAHLRVFAVVVGLTGAAGAQGEGERRHERGAGGEGDGARGVEDGRDGGEGLCRVEKGHGVLGDRRLDVCDENLSEGWWRRTTYLEEETEGHAGGECSVIDHGTEKGWTAWLGVVGAEASIEGLRERRGGGRCI